MSILLDAVTRNKQQQQTSPLADAVFTPRPSYPTPRQTRFPVAKLSLLAGAIALGVGGAWAVVNWQHSSSMAVLKANDAHNSNIHVGSVITEKPLTSGNDALATQAQINSEGSASATSKAEVLQATSPQRVSGTAGFRLAGKVALPREQTLTEQPLNDQRYVNSNLMSAQTVSATPATTTDPSYDDYLATSAALDEAVRQPASTDNIIAAPEVTETAPIMLGANANSQGLAALEALRQQVNAAAVDVGLDTVQSRQEDELVATFQDALKEVEYSKAATSPVTAPKLDPVPKTENDDIPKYGQLPAGLQLQVPEFNIVAHVYSTVASQRWLNVDGAELQEGDMIAGKLKIIAIRPRDIVLDIQGTQFRVPAI